MQHTVEVFMDHGRQVIRLPEGMHIDGEEVLIRQDAQTGAITLKPKDKRSEQERQKSWDGLFQMLAEIPQEERELFVIPRDPAPPQVRKTLR